MTTAQIDRMTVDRDRALVEQPPFTPLMAVVVDAWNMCGSERSIGFAVGPIPYRAVEHWCGRRPYLDDELTDAIVRAINQLDSDRSKKEQSKQPTTRPSPRSSR